jgi:hypothetical protein
LLSAAKIAPRNDIGHLHIYMNHGMQPLDGRRRNRSLPSVSAKKLALNLNRAAQIQHLIATNEGQSEKASGLFTSGGCRKEYLDLTVAKQRSLQQVSGQITQRSTFLLTAIQQPLIDHKGNGDGDTLRFTHYRQARERLGPTNG